MDRSLIDYLPQVLQTIREFKALINAEQPEASDLWAAFEDVMDDQFIREATENGISRWEKVLSIVPQATRTLDERRFLILAKINEQAPYSFNALKARLDSLCGADGYEVTVSNQTYTLTVKVALTAKNSFGDVSELLQRVVPANMVIDISLKYNQHQTLAAFTNVQLSNYTHYQLRNEVIT
jgi:hypothetical protein